MRCGHVAQDFNPRTHTGCDAVTRPRLPTGRISIHAPTRGATQATPTSGIAMQFQSTHPHGVRRYLYILWGEIHNFNPRTHTGCDLTGWSKGVIIIEISIHAPTRGATGANKGYSGTVQLISIHAPTRGATPPLVLVVTPVIISIHAPTRGATSPGHPDPSRSQFQSTHPHGVRPISRSGSRRRRNFNPRTHTGCDRG